MVSSSTCGEQAGVRQALGGGVDLVGGLDLDAEVVHHGRPVGLALDEHELQRRLGDREVGVAGAALGRLDAEELASRTRSRPPGRRPAGRAAHGTWRSSSSALFRSSVECRGCALVRRTVKIEVCRNKSSRSSVLASSTRSWAAASRWPREPLVGAAVDRAGEGVQGDGRPGPAAAAVADRLPRRRRGLRLRPDRRVRPVRPDDQPPPQGAARGRADRPASGAAPGSTTGCCPELLRPARRQSSPGPAGQPLPRARPDGGGA